MVRSGVVDFQVKLAVGTQGLLDGFFVDPVGGFVSETGNGGIVLTFAETAVVMTIEDLHLAAAPARGAGTEAQAAAAGGEPQIPDRPGAGKP